MIPSIHITRADGGFELTPMTIDHVVSFVQDATTSASGLIILAEQIAKAIQNRDDARALADAKVRAIEAAANAAEDAKLALNLAKETASVLTGTVPDEIPTAVDSPQAKK